MSSEQYTSLRILSGSFRKFFNNSSHNSRTRTPELRCLKFSPTTSQAEGYEYKLLIISEVRDDFSSVGINLQVCEAVISGALFDVQKDFAIF